jgi:hypothetical protein
MIEHTPSGENYERNKNRPFNVPSFLQRVASSRTNKKNFSTMHCENSSPEAEQLKT